MGFKAKARKHRKDTDSDKEETKKKSKQGDLSCAIKVVKSSLTSHLVDVHYP